MKRELPICVVVAASSLVVAALCHRFAPTLGFVLKPLLWPAAVLPFAVGPRLAMVTAFAVPLLSGAIVGMPTVPVALVLSCGALLLVAAVAFVRRLVDRHRMSREA